MELGHQLRWRHLLLLLLDLLGDHSLLEGFDVAEQFLARILVLLKRLGPLLGKAFVTASLVAEAAKVPVLIQSMPSNDVRSDVERRSARGSCVR